MNKYSGIVVNSNPSNTDTLPGQYYAQQFTLPATYPRANEYMPDLTGFQIFVHILGNDPKIDWELQRKQTGGDWVSVTEGSSSGLGHDEENGWMTFDFDAVVERLEDEWRVILDCEDCQPYYSITVPNGILTDVDTEIPIGLSNSSTVTTLFRVLAATADSGIDFLGNSFRSAVVRRPASYVSMTNSEVQNKSWLSKPNPSKFAVESLYFDMTTADDRPSVVNKMLIDTITPGVYFHVYYSNDENGPGTDEDSWDNLLWTRIPRSYLLDQKKTFTFPEPITAKYIKIEFTHLQARAYTPGNYQQKMSFKKHPKWVLDYFFGLYIDYKASTEILSDTISLTYDAFDFYYNYFVGDILESPDYPQLANDSIDSTIYNNFLNTTTSQELQNLDARTINQIRVRMDLFAKHPLLNGAIGSSLRTYGYPSEPVSTYSTEIATESIANTDLISTEDRESVILDKEFPIMSFYLPCRHQYKVSRSIFEHERAYFVGINQIAFERDDYSSDYNNNIYIETAGDEENVESNDLIAQDGYWTAT